MVWAERSHHHPHNFGRDTRRPPCSAARSRGRGTISIGAPLVRSSGGIADNRSRSLLLARSRPIEAGTCLPSRPSTPEAGARAATFEDRRIRARARAAARRAGSAVGRRRPPTADRSGLGNTHRRRPRARARIGATGEGPPRAGLSLLARDTRRAPKSSTRRPASMLLPPRCHPAASSCCDSWAERKGEAGVAYVPLAFVTLD
jgi:hypothetical protein